VLRQVVHVSLGGSQIKLQFSNLSGNGPVTINSAHVAICKATPSVDSTIDTTTDKALAFSGAASVTIPAGQEIWSDPLNFTMAAMANVSITVAFGSVPSNLTGHAGSRTTSYQQTASTNVSAASMTGAQTVVSWYYISGMQVMADPSAKAIVAMGDSLTDGRGTNNDQNDRWTDDLEARLQGNAPTANVGMLNMGIGGSVLIGTTGTAAQARFTRDVLNQVGAKYVIIFDGVNDILSANATSTAMQMAYAGLVSQAHSKGMLVYGATITPFGANSSYSAAREMVRQQVNTYIKTAGNFDGFFDFDAAVTDNGTPPALQTQYATLPASIGTDGLHMNPTGYQALANAVTPLSDFTK
jgi:lysophospholipase L1-like esterase